MSLQETASICLDLLEKHAPKPPGYALTPLERERALASGLMRRVPQPPTKARYFSRKPLQAGQKAYGSIADYARTLVREGFTDSVVDLAARIGVSAVSLAQALNNARFEAGLAAKPRVLPQVVRRAVAECKATPYRRGLFVEIARKHGASPKSVIEQLNREGITARVLRKQRVQPAAA